MALPIKLTLVFLPQLILCNVLHRIDENGDCRVCLGDRVDYECTTIGRDVTTKYMISGNELCTLALINSHFSRSNGAEDECQNRGITAHSVRIEEDNYTSNASFTVDFSPIVIQCLSDTTEVGVRELDIITNDNFRFQAEVVVAQNLMERVCVFSWNSSCSTNYYNFSTNCTNCSLHGTSVTCSNVQLGVVCSLSVQEVRCNRTSQESNQAVCDMKDTTAPSTSSQNIVAIAVGTVLPLFLIITISLVVGMLAFLYCRYRKRRRKQKMEVYGKRDTTEFADHETDALNVSHVPTAELPTELPSNRPLSGSSPALPGTLPSGGPYLLVDENMLKRIVSDNNKELLAKQQAYDDKCKELEEEKKQKLLLSKQLEEAEKRSTLLQHTLKQRDEQLRNMSETLELLKNQMKEKDERIKQLEKETVELRQDVAGLSYLVNNSMGTQKTIMKHPMAAADPSCHTSPVANVSGAEVDKQLQHTELKAVEEISRHQDVKSTHIDDDSNNQNVHTTTEADTTSDHSVQYDHSISDDNNTTFYVSDL